MHLRMTDDHDELRAVTSYGFSGVIAASVALPIVEAGQNVLPVLLIEAVKFGIFQRLTQ